MRVDNNSPCILKIIESAHTLRKCLLVTVRASASGLCSVASNMPELSSAKTLSETNANKKKGGFMASQNFTNTFGDFTVSDQALGGRNGADSMGWSMDDWGKLHSAAAGLDQDDVLVGSPSTSTYRHWFEQSGLFLYTNP
jgi:hypothetical protein